MFVVWVDTKKAGLLLVNLPLVYLVDLFTEELYKDLNYMFRLILFIKYTTYYKFTLYYLKILSNTVSLNELKMFNFIGL